MNAFLLIILSTIFYCLSNRAISEKKHLNLVKIVYGYINSSLQTSINGLDEVNISSKCRKFLSRT
jgi:hypothetical protein